jgi:hypothetical protein
VEIFRVFYVGRFHSCDGWFTCRSLGEGRLNNKLKSFLPKPWQRQVDGKSPSPRLRRLKAAKYMPSFIIPANKNDDKKI